MFLIELIRNWFEA